MLPWAWYGDSRPQYLGWFAAAAIATALVQPPHVSAAPEPDRTYAELVAENHINPYPELAGMLNSDNVAQRRFAVLSLSEHFPDSLDALRLTIEALSDPTPLVREQVLASLMRRSGKVPNEIMEALVSFKSAGQHEYFSEAYNGRRALPITVSALTFAVLAHTEADPTDQILSLYAEHVGSDTASVPERSAHLNINAIEGDRAQTVRERLLLAVKYLSRRPTTMFVAATLSTDEELKLAALRAARYRNFKGPELMDALEQNVRQGNSKARNLAALLLAQSGVGGRDRLRTMLGEESPDVRAAALRNLPSNTPGLGMDIKRFLESGQQSDRQAALLSLYRALPNYGACYGSDSANDRPKIYIELSANNHEELNRIVMESNDSAQLRPALRIVSYLTCGNRLKRERLVNLLAISLKNSNNDRLEIVAGYLDNWTSDKTLILQLEAKRAVADAMARAAITQEGQRSVSDLVRVFLNLSLTKQEARSLLPQVATTFLADSEYWIGRSELSAVMKQNGAGDILIKRLLKRLPTTGDSVKRVYRTIAANEPRSERFSQWQLKLLDHPDPNLVADVAFDIIRQDERDGREKVALGKLAGILRSIEKGKNFWSLGLDVTERLVALGSTGISFLIELMARDDLDGKARSIIYELAAIEGRAQPKIRDFLLEEVRSAKLPERQEAAVSALASLRDSSEEIQSALLYAVRSPNYKVRLAAIKAWRMALFPADPMLDYGYDDKSPEVRAEAIALLANLPEAGIRKTEYLRKAFAGKHKNVHEAAYDVLSEIDEEAVPFLIELVEGTTPLPPKVVSAINGLDKLDLALRAALEKRSAIEKSMSVNSAKGILEEFDLSAVLLRGRPAFFGQRETEQHPLTRHGLSTLRKNLKGDDPQLRTASAGMLVAHGTDPWADGGLLAAVMMEAKVSEIVQKRFGKTLDLIHPPGMMLMSGRNYGLPKFPWPPPAGYSAYSIPRSLVGGSSETTLGDVYHSLVTALSEVSDNFEHGLFTGPPEGFAVVARLERVKQDGTPYPEPARWIKEGQPALNLFDLLGDLFFAQPGYFRTIVFAITSDATPESNPDETLPEPGIGAKDIPPELAVKPFGENLFVLALVYSFERKLGAQIQPWRDGAPSAQRHLARGGVLSQLPGSDGTEGK